jgi:Ca2+-binding RTX toxin-like protein
VHAQTIEEKTMAYTISQDSLQSTDFGYLFTQGEVVTIATEVVVSSTENYGVVSLFANSHLINNGHVISLDTSSIGVAFLQSDSSIFNAAGASIAGIGAGVYLQGDNMSLTNAGTIHGLLGAGVVVITATNGLLVNSNSIIGREAGVLSYGNAGVAEIRNTGIMKGDAFGYWFDGRNTTDNGLVKILNAAGASITGSEASVEVIAADTARIWLDNRGTLNGQVFIDNGVGNDVVINRGTIRGSVFLGDGNDVFNGTGGRSGAVDGYHGNDTLVGGDGRDRLSGGAGNDRLTGHRGADSFIFDSELKPATNVDLITDLAVNIDKIVLISADGIFAGAGPAGVLSTARFHLGVAAADASDRVIYNPNTGALYYDHDGRGGDAQLRFAQLTKHLALDHADFLVVVPI